MAMVASTTLLCEFLNWLLLFRTSKFKALKSDLLHSAELNKQSKKRGKLIAHQKRNAQVFGYQISQMAINLLVMGSAFKFVTYYYKGVTVAKLPFEPFSFMAQLTHRGLDSDDLTDCSSHLIYILSTMAMKTLWPKFFNVEAQKMMIPPVLQTPKLE